jgi:hypothetical protein
MGSRSSLRHNRELYGVDASGEGPEEHGEQGSDGGRILQPILMTKADGTVFVTAAGDAIVRGFEYVNEIG